MTNVKRILNVGLCLAALQVSARLPFTAPAATRRELRLNDVVPVGRGQSPGSFQWGPDGSKLGFLQRDDDGHSLWLLDPVLGKKRRLVSAADLSLADDTPESIDAYHWSPQGDTVLLEADGDLFLLDLADEARPRRLTATEATETDPEFSPAGDAVVFVRDHDLHLLDLASSGETALTSGGKADETLNGETDWVYWEEIWGRSSSGHWFSPDGRRVAYYQFDETPVPSYALLNSLPQYPEVAWQKYPKAGQNNPVVRVGVLSVPDGETVWMDTGSADGYLARVHWTPDGKGVGIQRLNREQNRLNLLLCDATSGQCDNILTESWPTWVNLGDDFAFLKDGRFIWGSDRLGWRHLYLYGADGKRSKRLTPEGWSVTSLDGVDEEAGELIVTAFRTEPWGATDRHVLHLPLQPQGGEVNVLSDRDGWSSAVVAPGTGLWLHSWSDADTPTERFVRGAVLDRPVPLPDAALDYDPAALPQWEFLTIEGKDGVRLPARMLRPDGFRTGRKYPVIMYHYGGPGSQVVTNRWGARGRAIWHKKMAQQGYLVFSVDNPAAIFFGKDGEDKAHRRFGEINLAAQLAAVDYLKSRPFVDSARIGLWGWSGGGTHTLYCLLNRPGVWRAGVSGAPVTDWRLYDSIWTERYLDHPEDNPEGYKQSSPLTYAEGLKDRLLIVHGTADDNVHPQNTLVMIDALVKAGIQFEDAIYPRQKHGFGSDSQRHFFQRMTDFFERNLGTPLADRR